MMAGMKKLVALAGLIALGFTATACTAMPVEEHEESGTSETTEPVEVETPAAEAPQVGTRENPVPFGDSYTFEDIGEAGGEAWTVTIDEPTDITQAVIDDAVELYHGDEEYVAYSRPDDGMMFLGVPGTVERLLDFPEDPMFAFSVAIITPDGKTLTDSADTPDDKTPLMDIGEMYAPAKSEFVEGFSVPEGTTGQVLVTMSNTGERIYFGE